MKVDAGMTRGWRERVGGKVGWESEGPIRGDGSRRVEIRGS
jgi:hypothetical protein